MSNILTPLNQGLVGHWDFNGNAKDRTPYGNDGTVTGATLTTDRFGRANSAYAFDGNDKITTTIVPSGETTVALWFNSSDTSTTKGLVNFCPGLPRGHFNFNHTSGLPGYPLLYLASANFRYWTNINSYMDGKWHFLVLYIKGQAKDDILSASLRIDNNVIGISGGGTANTETPLTWTGFNISDGAYGGLIGSMCDVRLYNRALSATEVLNLYKLT